MLLLFHLHDQQSLLCSDIIKRLQPQFPNFLTSAMTDLLATGIFNLANPEIAFSFLLWSTAFVFKHSSQSNAFAITDIMR